jgi:hypothetical protein
MSHGHGLRIPRAARASVALLALASLGLFGCDGSDDDDNDPTNGGMCFPDADGLTGGSYTFELTVTDTGFSKTVLSTQDNSMVTLKLTNAGTTPHGFQLDCVDPRTVYTKLPAMCPTMICFPDAAKIAPIAPGESKTVTFSTPTADNLIYPFRSGEPGDSAVAGLNNGQWTIM